jgi:hypothetical protein
VGACRHAEVGRLEGRGDTRCLVGFGFKPADVSYDPVAVVVEVGDAVLAGDVEAAAVLRDERDWAGDLYIEPFELVVAEE